MCWEMQWDNNLFLLLRPLMSLLSTVYRPMAMTCTMFVSGYVESNQTASTIALLLLVSQATYVAISTPAIVTKT